MKYFFSLLILLSLFLSKKSQAQLFVFDDTPNWVHIIDIPSESKVSKYDVIAGFYLSLADYQYNLDEDTYYSREVRNIIAHSGITEASQLSIRFDSLYQKLKIHHLFIWRDGKKVDRTSDLSFEIINQEERLHQGIYTGIVTAYDILNDTRKGDLIDFAYSLVGENPIFEGNKFLFNPLVTMNPTDLYSLRIIYSKDKQYNYECIDCDSLNFKTTEGEKIKTSSLIYRNLKGMSFEENIPGWTIPFKYFSLTSFNTWMEVNSWAQGVFSLENEPVFDNVFDEIFDGDETEIDKINKLIDFVQDDIRYMGIESGLGSIKPFPPEQVLLQRFGDCKDKSLLLVSLLKSIGIEKAYPVLVSTKLKQGTVNFLPNNKTFDHCIVNFEYKGSSYWLDPTVQQQGGDFRELSNTNYGKVLIIGKEFFSLHDMIPQQSESVYQITEELIIENYYKPASLTITSFRKGLESDRMRMALSNVRISDLTKDLTQKLNFQYPDLKQVDKATIDDNMDSNTFVINYSYDANGFWIDGMNPNNEVKSPVWVFKYEPVILYRLLNLKKYEERKFDYELPYPMNVNYRVIIHFPNTILVDDKLEVIENNAFYFSTMFEQISTTSIQIDYTYKIKAKSVNAASYKNYCSEKNRLVKEIPTFFVFLK